MSSLRYGVNGGIHFDATFCKTYVSVKVIGDATLIRYDAAEVERHVNKKLFIDGDTWSCKAFRNDCQKWLDKFNADYFSKPIDPVAHPSHYNTGKIEVIEFVEDQKLSFHTGNVIKYICRAPYKGSHLQDLKKAQWYLEREIELVAAATEKREPIRPNDMGKK